MAFPELCTLPIATYHTRNKAPQPSFLVVTTNPDASFISLLGNTWKSQIETNRHQFAILDQCLPNSFSTSSILSFTQVGRP